MCSYVGEVTGEGVPHGYGEWRDNSYHGEHLRWVGSIQAGGQRVGGVGLGAICQVGQEAEQR
jgi:hypothetical protein